MGLIAWSFVDHCKQVIMWTNKVYSRPKWIQHRSKKEVVWSRRQDSMQKLRRKAVGKPRAVWKDKSWGGDFCSELSVDVYLLCQQQEVGCVCPAWLQTCCPNGREAHFPFSIYPPYFQTDPPPCDTVTWLWISFCSSHRSCNWRLSCGGIHVLVSRWTEYQLPQVCQNVLPTCDFLPAQSQL